MLISIQILCALACMTPELDAQAVIVKASQAQYYAADDGRALVRLQIVDPQGRKMRRQFAIVRKDAVHDDKGHGDQFFLVRFDRPADVRNTVFLVLKKEKGNDDRWLYLPALDLVKRIAARDKRTSFVGSHLYYEDVSGRGPFEDSHKILSETEEYWLIQGVPKKSKWVEFSKYVVKIRKKDYLPSQIEYFDRDEKVIRRIQAVRIETYDGYPTITRMKITNVLSGGYTLVAFSHVKYNIKVPDTVFTEQSLRNPPAQWLRTK